MLSLRHNPEPGTGQARLSPTSLVHISLRNHLCVVALRSQYGRAFHLGTLVRTMFECFYLYEAGYGDADPAVFSRADAELGSLSLLALEQNRYFLSEPGFRAAVSLLELYDRQLQHTPLQSLIKACEKADRNFRAEETKRMPMEALVQRLRSLRAMGVRRAGKNCA
ncbi:hypothetical protein Bcep1808_6671 (plasmid) [Burkholderia vietnamiensis G4]|uniref:Uncharacterized protein n=1 Tax=Burkholderia vietnamiensis (strain G4 / LMG 22486) TaxID=269482 RepID=A4JTF7_BURVG|nr:hypothetical protein Bcep1808_6671 [Burkholderia vietnamiensis G4]